MRRWLAHELGMSTFDDMLDLAQKLGLQLRHVHLGGEGGGGLVKIRGQRQLFIDLDADPADQLEAVARALAAEADLEAVFVRPDVRAEIEKYR
jgi:hypothetical protein